MINRHPVDKLAEVRAQLKALADRETELKGQVSALMGLNDALFGADFVAFQKLSSRKGAVDTAAMAKAGIDLAPFRKPDLTVLSIVVERCERRAAA